MTCDSYMNIDEIEFLLLIQVLYSQVEVHFQFPFEKKGLALLDHRSTCTYSSRVGAVEVGEGEDDHGAQNRP